MHWHTDFKTGYRWTQSFFLDMVPIHPPVHSAMDPLGCDVKVPWELSRFHHGVSLAQAYRLTGEQPYLQELINQVSDWIARNPVGIGVNWTCTMDVGIRAANWVLALSYAQQQGESQELTSAMARSLWLHAFHIRRNLEQNWKGEGSNHLLSDLVGLLYVGLAFRHLPEGQRWIRQASRRLSREMRKQVYPDGFGFEGSSAYHRLSLELFFYSAWLCRCHDIPLPQAFWESLHRMFRVALHIMKPDGTQPQLGDNDSGRLHILFPRPVPDISYLLGYAAVLFDDSEFKRKGVELAPEVLWVFGEGARERWEALPVRSEPIGSGRFRHAGVHVLRHEDDYMLVSCGPNGLRGGGGHAHNDKLSFELSIDGRNLIVDPGTFVYTAHPAWRNLFRSTRFHNTVVVDGHEQNPIHADRVFSLPDVTRCRCLTWTCSSESDLFAGEHQGYRGLHPPVLHRRTVDYRKGERTWRIMDQLISSAETRPVANPGTARIQLEMNLHLAPGVDVRLLPVDSCPRDRQGGPTEPSSRMETGPRFQLTCEGTVLASVLASGWTTAHRDSGWYSPEYGVKEPVVVVRLACLTALPADLELLVMTPGSYPLNQEIV
jgi:hypothetical protein